jgi:hypothetical protein
LRRDELPEQGVIGDLNLDRELRRRKGEGADGRGLGPQARAELNVIPGVVDELGELGVDMVPGVDAPGGRDVR